MTPGVGVATKCPASDAIVSPAPPGPSLPIQGSVKKMLRPARRALRPHAPAMTLDHLVDDRQAHAGAVEFLGAMQALEYPEQLVRVAACRSRAPLSRTNRTVSSPSTLEPISTRGLSTRLENLRASRSDSPGPAAASADRP